MARGRGRGWRASFSSTTGWHRRTQTQRKPRPRASRLSLNERDPGAKGGKEGGAAGVGRPWGGPTGLRGRAQEDVTETRAGPRGGSPCESRVCVHTCPCTCLVHAHRLLDFGFQDRASRLCGGSWDTYPETCFLLLLNGVCPGQCGSGDKQLPNPRGPRRRAFPSRSQRMRVAVTCAARDSAPWLLAPGPRPQEPPCPSQSPPRPGGRQTRRWKRSRFIRSISSSAETRATSPRRRPPEADACRTATSAGNRVRISVPLKGEEATSDRALNHDLRPASGPSRRRAASARARAVLPTAV